MITMGTRRNIFVINALALFMALCLSFSANAQPSTKRIVALGDSLTAGFGLKQGEAFPDQLQRALSFQGLSVKVDNAGVSGDTTNGGLNRLEWSLGGEQVPDLVIIELGANDALRGLSVENSETNLRAILQKLSDKNINVLLAGMRAPPNMGDEYANAFDAIYPKLAAEFGISLYPFFLDGVIADPKLNLADGIHPTAEGIGIITKRILPFVTELLD